MKREAKTVWLLNGHTHCIQLCGICYDMPGLIFEYCNSGTLRSLLYKTVHHDEIPYCRYESLRRLRLEEKVSLVSQLIQGLYYLHNKGFVHRDLKSENCLIHNYGTKDLPLWNLKITDLGSSRTIAHYVHSRSVMEFLHSRASQPEKNEHLKTQTGGSLRWLTPERRKRIKDPEKRKQIESHTSIDVYALGCIIGEIFIKQPPYAEQEKIEEVEDLGEWIKELQPTELPYTEEQIESLPKELAELIRRCCEGEVSKRITMVEIVYQKWPEVCIGLGTVRTQKKSHSRYERCQSAIDS